MGIYCPAAQEVPGRVVEIDAGGWIRLAAAGMRAATVYRQIAAGAVWRRTAERSRPACESGNPFRYPSGALRQCSQVSANKVAAVKGKTNHSIAARNISRAGPPSACSAKYDTYAA